MLKELQFNIIYTPGTVKHLSFFVWSLLDWSNCSFRLVSNGCHPAEQRYLQNLCAQDSRLEFWSVPTRNCLPHGQVLNYLQAKNRADHFCFMDSDIFATGDFLRTIPETLLTYAGVFSGLPIWVKKDEVILPHAFRHMVGTFNQSDAGNCLGSTYAALYDNRILTDVMQSTGIGFEEYHWHDIPGDLQQQILKLDLEKETYDTGKVLNLLMLSRNQQLINLDIPSLCHIGGTSFQVHYDSQPQSLKKRILNQVMHTSLVAPLKALQQRRATVIYQKRYKDSPKSEFEFNLQQRSLQRNPVRQYLLLLINALFQDLSIPSPPLMGDKEIDIQIASTKEQIVQLFEKYKDRIDYGE